MLSTIVNTHGVETVLTGAPREQRLRAEYIRRHDATVYRSGSREYIVAAGANHATAWHRALGR